MKKLFIHIGHLKTGTSSIQFVLDKNADILRSQGIHYFKNFRAQNNPTNHSLFALELLSKVSGNSFKPYWYRESHDFDLLIETLVSEINSSECEYFVLSSEEFSRALNCHSAILNHLKHSIKKCCGDIEIVCLFFARAPFDFLKSWYNQLNKPVSPSADRSSSFLEFFMTIDPNFISQFPIFELFKKNLADHCKCCMYSSGYDSLALFTDLLSKFGCNISSNLFSTVRKNELNLSRQTVELLRLVHSNTSFDNATLSRSFSIPEALNKLDLVNKTFSYFTSNDLLINPPSQYSDLSFSALLIYYSSLLELTADFSLLNQKEIDILRDRAVDAKQQFPKEALQCLLLANKFRPKGQYIISQIKELQNSN